MKHPRQTQKLYGQEKAEKVFKDAFALGNLHHAWLLTGEKGIGKATFAYWAAKFLLSGSDNFSDHVLQKIENQSHPDLFVLEMDEEGNEIKVDDARELSNFTTLTAAMGDKKVIIIDSINDLNNNAANSLLKLLEEPQNNTYFFLVCHSISSILPTIKSRCRQLAFNPLSLLEFKKIMATQTKQNEEAITEIYELAKGSMHFAKLLLKPNALDVYKLTEESLGSNKLDFREMQKLMASASDDEEWQIVKFAFHNTLLEQITQKAKNFTLTEKQMELAFKRLSLLQKAELFHLDRAQLIAAMLS